MFRFIEPENDQTEGNGPRFSGSADDDQINRFSVVVFVHNADKSNILSISASRL
mgnify:CR=1 FL=1